jgi:tetratricopeptide (TPR) repeat protein
LPFPKDYPKLLDDELQTALREHDLDEAARLFRGLLQQHGSALELWAELLDELAHHGYGWADWAEHWAGGENALDRPAYFLVLGIQALQEEAFDKAGYYLQRCVECSPLSPVPLAYMGIMCESQGCPAEALTYYRRCLDLDPDLFSVLNASGNLYHELGFYQEAVDHYHRAAPLLFEPCNQAILLGNLGNSLRALGNLDEAIAVYTEAIALDPSQPSAPIFLAETLLEARRTPLVISCLTDMLQMPEFDDWPRETQIGCYGLLARAYCQAQQFGPGVFFHWLRNGSRLDEDDREGVSALLKALFGWAVQEQGLPCVEYLLAKINRNLGYLDAALHHAKRAVKLQPERPDHFIELGAALLLQGKQPVALEAFEEALVLAPDRAEAHAMRAMAQWEEDPYAAADAIREAIRLEPNQALHHCDLAFLHHAAGDADATAAAFARALLLWDRAPIIYGPHGPASQRGCYSDVTDPYLAENANSPEAADRLLTAANYLILSGRREMARKALHRLLTEQPAQVDALRTYAWLLTRGGWLPEALSIWRKVLVLVPQDGVSRYFALKCLASEGSEGKAAAIAELELAVEARANDHLARLLLAKLLEPEAEALRHLEALCFQLPNVYSSWYYRGQSLFHRREAEHALPCLEKAVQLNANFAPARQLLSQVHLQLGRMVASHVELGTYHLLVNKVHLARRQFEEALALDPDCSEAFSGLEKVERRLARLENPTPQDLYQTVRPRFRAT